MRTIVVLISIMILLGCENKDKGIKQSIAVNAKEQLMFAGVNYTVSNGVVTLVGTCPSEELKNKLLQSLQSKGGVKKVVDRISIGAVMLDNDFVLKQKVDSVLADYASVDAYVKNGVAIVNGAVEKEKADKLLQSLHQLPLAGVINNTTMKQ